MLGRDSRLSYHTNPIFQLETSVSEKDSLCWDPEKEFGFNSIISIPSSDISIRKSSAELRKEIAIIEFEILRLERYLLTLYRSAFKENLSTINNINTNGSKYNTRSASLPAEANRSYCKVEPHESQGDFVPRDQTFTAQDREILDLDSCPASLKSASTRDSRKSDSGHCSLGNLLGGSHVKKNLDTPDRLSEEIVGCISSIYCKLSTGPINHAGSPTSSVSSSMFSSKYRCDSWSPSSKENAGVHYNEEIGPDTAIIEVLKICLNDDSFNYAATMLQKFRLLIQKLEKVDPSKMKREEKLAFWINIHNALLMHAYLAYGARDRVKTASILKAAYNIGGHCMNAYIIQTSILGIWPHHSVPLLQTLFSSGKKIKAGSVTHIFALEYPEPLVHFAICSGAYSDPMVRVYNAKNIFNDLKLAKEEFIKGSMYIDKDKRIFLPKILRYYVRDMSLDLVGLWEVISPCLSKAQQKVLRKCIKERQEKCIHWIPQNTSFRYVIDGNLAKEKKHIIRSK
ncbi:hypothetical protein ACFE04_008675 [Oxalis oulophora]